MISKSLLLIVVVYYLSGSTHGQSAKKFFRDDYNYIEAVDSFYKIHTTPRTWEGAKQQCALEGATLWHPDNDAEAQAVKSFWRTTQPTIGWVHVGLSDIATEGLFKTVDGKPVSEVYNKWLAGQPGGGSSQNCVYIYKDYDMDDWSCDSAYNFICKKSDGYNYIEAVDSFYKIHTTPRTWEGAKQQCALEGATLWHPDNDAEAQAVKSFWRTTQPNIGWVYVGLSDMATEGVFKTINGKTVSEVYNKWQPSQPSGGSFQNCVYIYKDYDMDDWSCDSAYNFICKKDQKFFRSDYSYLEAVDSFYKIHMTPRTWTDAKQQCALEGATLWHPDNDAETQAVKSFWRTTQPTIGWVYVGLSDMATEGVFRTIDGKSVSEVYNKWLAGQPGGGSSQNCVYIYKDYDMDDWSCDSAYNFICKKSQNYFRYDYNYIVAVDSFYKIHTTPRTWTDAKQQCTLEGATLWHPDNDAEAQAVKSFWRTTQPTIGWVYVGLSDMATEGVFKTIDGKPVSEVYNKWQPSQPSGGSSQNCVYIYKDYDMDDWSCDSVYNFICKKSQKSFRYDYSYLESVESFYKIHTTPRTWTDAKQQCALEGATLWHPDNDAEAQAVKSFWRTTQTNIWWVHVGLSDMATEGVFKTVEGKSISEVYNKWVAGQPDGGSSQNCVYIYREADMDDWSCDTMYNFICKKSLQSLEPSHGTDLVVQKAKKFYRDDYSYIEAVDSFYKIHTTPRAWTDAMQQCALEGATLWHPDNDAEAQAVKSFWRTTQPNIGWVHVGLSDMATEGVFKTVEGKSVSEVYNKWVAGQPGGGSSQNCVYIYKEADMDDWSCDTMYNFICKKSLQSLEPSHGTDLVVQKAKKFYRDDYSYIEAVDSFYKIHTTPRAWTDAKQQCALEGATLWHPDNDAEAQAVKSFWRTTQPNIGWVHVGLSDMATEGVFKTVEGKSVSEVYNKWVAGQPGGGSSQNCVYIYRESDMDDWSCDTMYNFICKKSLQSLEPSHGTDLVVQKAKNFYRDDYSYIEAVDSFYKIHTTPRAWTDAKQQCALEGATLWHPDNDAEAHAVKSFWNTTQPTIGWVYVGLSDIATEGVFKTIDGKSVSEVYNKWQPGQPDDSGSSQDCVYIYKDYEMDDWSCDTMYNFICKKSLQSLEPSSGTDLALQNGKKFFRDDYSYIEALDSFYKIHTTARTWTDAKQQCALEGATLWHPDNDAEAQAVKSFWNTTQPTIGWVYVGLSDMATEGEFKTIDGRAVSEVYNKWQPGQPDDSGSSQDCVYIYKDYEMDDWSCDDMYNFICKKSLQSLKPSYDCNVSNSGYTSNKDNGKCYKLHTTPKNWNDSYATCCLEQSHLAVITNQQEADYLVNLTKSTPNPKVKENYQRGIYHVGFHNKLKKGWQTVKGTPMNVDANLWWGSYQPADDRDQCGSMFFTGHLIDTDCDMKSFFICEHEAATSCTELATISNLSTHVPSEDKII